MSAPDKISLLSLETQETRELRCDLGPSNALQFSPDGRYLAVLFMSGALSLWELTGGTPASQPSSQPSLAGDLAPLVAPEGAAWSVQAPLGLWVSAFSHDGRWLAVAGADAALYILSSQDGRLRKKIQHPGNGVSSMEFSPDDALLAYVGYDDKLRMLHLETGELKPMAGHTALVNGLSFSSDGARVFTVSDDATMRIWDVKSGRSRSIPGGESPLKWLSLHDEETIFAGSPEGIIQWSLKPQEEESLAGLRDAAKYKGDTPLRTMALTTDGSRLFYAGPQGSVRVYDMARKEQTILGAIQGSITALTISPDARYVLIGSDKGHVSLWDTSTEQREEVVSDSVVITALGFSPDGRWFASGDGDGDVRLWEVSTRDEVLSVNLEERVFSLAFSPDARFFAAGALGRRLRLWSLAALHQAPRDLPIKRGTPISMLFIHDELCAATGWSVVCYDPSTGAQTAEIEGNQLHDSLALSSGTGLLAIVGRGGAASLWDISTRRQVRRLLAYQSGDEGVSFLQNGAVLATSGLDGNLRLWDVASGELRVLYGHQERIYQLISSPDQKTLISASLDGTIKIWRDALPTSPRELRSLIEEQSHAWDL